MNFPGKNRSLIRQALASVVSFSLVLTATHVGADVGHIALVEKGKGSTLVFIPGLNSGAETFTDTCEALAASHRCLLLQLPGFAGHPPVAVGDGFLRHMKEDLLALLRQHNEGTVTLVGHSLGGVLSMMVGLEAPDLVDKLVLIDSLPYTPAIQNPALTVADVEPQAAMMRRQIDAASDELFYQNAVLSMNGMTRSAERIEQLQTWTRTSDRATTTAAMYELMTIDLRAAIAQLQQPVLVLGAWAAYKPYGSTLESTKAIFATQYAAVLQVEIHMSQDGYHFLSWDDPGWVSDRIAEFVAGQ